jgi:hypothetical protein
VQALGNGDSIILFPEGTRGHGEEPQPFKAGLYNLALRFPQVVLVPAWIDNVQRVMPKGEVVPVPILCSVTFGAPVALDPARTGTCSCTAPAKRSSRCATSERIDARLPAQPHAPAAGRRPVPLGLRPAGVDQRGRVPDDLPHARRRARRGLARGAARLPRLLGTSWFMVVVFWIGWAAGDAVATVLFALIAFLALREFITLSPTRRGDHRSLVLAFFVVLPVQFWLAATRHFDLFTVFIPVYVFLAIPLASALGGDTQRFLERNAKLQWGIMVCVYGMSHVPALMLLRLQPAQFRRQAAPSWCSSWCSWSRPAWWCSTC